jgi:WhiB family redox-sensing transcriptional regulator
LLPGSKMTTPQPTEPSEATKTSLTRTVLGDTASKLFVQREPWMVESLCKDKGHLFFSAADYDEGGNAKSEPGRPQRIEEAKAICHECPVKWECLEWAIRTDLEHGIAGEMTRNERRKYVRAKRAEHRASEERREKRRQYQRMRRNTA